MTLNEGGITRDAKILMKSVMLRQLASLKQTTPNEWERAVWSRLPATSARMWIGISRTTDAAPPLEGQVSVGKGDRRADPLGYCESCRR
jgi:hypothetical protein